MARRWRKSHPGEAPGRVRAFMDAHQRLNALAREAGLGPADVVVHDLSRAELRSIWEAEKMVIVVDEIDLSSAAEA